LFLAKILRKLRGVFLSELFRKIRIANIAPIAKDAMSQRLAFAAEWGRLYFFSLFAHNSVVRGGG